MPHISSWRPAVIRRKIHFRAGVFRRQLSAVEIAWNKSSQDFGLLLFDSYTGLLGRLLEPILTIGLVLLGRGPCVEPSNNAEGELLRGGTVEGARLAGPASQTA